LFDNVWQGQAPTTPTWPTTFDDFITQAQQSQQQPTVVVPQPTPAP